ncbi:phospholipase effector Tle1 domain-containing protein [Pectobacterium polaris]|uniref:DUF2235 domain-containing protein n=1 Tax=Pectobacterium polaris TaxID=2042057 RepID=A0AAW5GAN6_9GAMM|nr:DUF2235 domain-containing protein [Pectobacterium polaris]MCL6350146.1 hypothetical protein [Pectobacterium polaris]MCL6367930.1 hypothetical protein [Pectobacterium polaris]
MYNTLRYRIYKLITAALCCIVLGACTSLISGTRSVPVRVSDLEDIEKALAMPMDAPLITHPIGHRPVKIYKVAFDGTFNDRTRIPLDERETLVARIARQVNADRYYPGVGMQSSGIDYRDGISGASSFDVAEQAKREFFVQASKWLLDNPNTDIRVFVTGFSRGAATARHFINLVTQQWSMRFGTIEGLAASTSPRFYALLYDTVATGQNHSLMLNIPSSVDYLVHFYATNETRNQTFAPIIDSDPTPLPFLWHFQPTPRRINLIRLPGAHSDIGASYPKGISDVYIQLTEQFLYAMGLSENNCWESDDNPLLAGKHDSRGLLDKLFGSLDPTQVNHAGRNDITKPASPLTLEEQAMVADRLQAMYDANADRGIGMYVQRTVTWFARMQLRKTANSLELLSVDKNIDPASVTFTPEGDSIRLKYRFSGIGDGSDVLLAPKTLKQISAESEGSELAITFIEEGNTANYAIWIDDKLAVSKSGFISETRIFSQPIKHCHKQPDGTLRSPIETHILHTPTVGIRIH